MNSNDHQRLYRLLEFKVLNPKRKKLIAGHLIEGISLARGCTLLGLNLSREVKREDIKACLAAYTKAGDPDGKAAMWETIRRVELMWKRTGPTTPDPAFAKVNLPFDGVFVTPDGQAVDAKGRPTAAPEPLPSTAGPSTHLGAFSEWEQALAAEQAELASRSICSHCQGPMVPPGTIAGTHVYCPTCADAWHHTGNFVACMQPQCPTCTKHGLTAK
jgi:hypothetical protein